MYHHMLQVNHQIKDDDGDDGCDQQGHLKIIKQAPAIVIGKESEANQSCRKQQAQDDGIQNYQGQVVTPAQPLAQLQLATGKEHFKSGNHQQDTKENPQPDYSFIADNDVVQNAQFRPCIQTYRLCYAFQTTRSNALF